MKAAFFAHPLLALALALGCGGGAAAQPVIPAPADNVMADAARSVGVKQCLGAVERLSTLAISGAMAHDVLVDWDRAQPDTGPFFSLIGVDFGRQSVAATVTVVPDGKGGCTVAAERISVAPYTCESVATVELKGYSVSRLLPTFTVYTTPADRGASVSLIDSPPGCLVIRRHVQYGWREPGAAPVRK